MEDDWSVWPHWPALAGLLCEHVAGGSDGLLRELQRLGSEGRLTPSETETLVGMAERMQSTGKLVQQIVRLGAGSLRPAPEHVDMARLAKQVSHERLREFLRRGAEISFDIRPADTMVDGSVAQRLLNAGIDWALSFSRRVRLRVGTSHGMVRVVVRATLPQAGHLQGAPAPERNRRMNDNLHWLLLRQLAASSQVNLSRSSTAATEAAVLHFPNIGYLPAGARSDGDRGG